jgi:hypothetical protein
VGDVRIVGILPAMPDAPKSGAGRSTRDVVLPPGAAGWHLATAVVTTAGLLLQLTLTLAAGGPVLPVRLLQWVSHFSVQAAVLVAGTGWLLAARPTRGIGTSFRVARLDGVLGVTVTGLVYLVVLRPVLQLDGWSAVADSVLHYLVPLLAVVGWVVYGPRRRVDRRIVGLALGWPAAFFAWTLAHGAISGYYPYPFVDAGELGYGSVLANAGAATGVLLTGAAVLLWADGRLVAWARRPRRA